MAGTKSNAPAPQKWRNEQPGRRLPATEADAHEASIERYSTTPHRHNWITTRVNLVAGPEYCEHCGVPRRLPGDYPGGRCRGCNEPIGEQHFGWCPIGESER